MFTSTQQLHVSTATGNAAHLQRLHQIEESKKTEEQRRREDEMYESLKKWLFR